MKDEYLKAYQQRIEEIKELDVSPEEKRKLAADAKNEILDQYKNSYIKEKEEAAQNEAKAAQENTVNLESEEASSNQAVEELEDEESEIQISEVVEKEEPAVDELDSEESELEEPVLETDDSIDNILNKLEEREERGEVGVELDTPTAFMDPDALFATMNLDELFTSLGIEDDFEDVELGTDPELTDLDDMFMDSEALFAGLLDDIEDEVLANDILNEFDLDEDTKPLEPSTALDEQTALAFKVVNEDQESTINSIETEVDEVEELVEGTIVDDEEFATEDEELDPNSINELEELEKERERAQKLGAIEMALLVVLIVLVVIVVYLIIGV